MSILGQRTKQVLEFYLKSNEHKDEIDTKAQETWKKCNEDIFRSVHSSMHQPDVLKLESLIGIRMEYLSSIDMDEAGSETNVLWMGGTVERVSHGTWLMPGASAKFYKKGETAEVYWDAVPEANYPPGRTTEKFDKTLWNKDKVGAWRRDHDKVDYGT